LFVNRVQKNKDLTEDTIPPSDGFIKKMLNINLCIKFK